MQTNQAGQWADGFFQLKSDVDKMVRSIVVGLYNGKTGSASLTLATDGDEDVLMTLSTERVVKRAAKKVRKKKTKKKARKKTSKKK